MDLVCELYERSCGRGIFEQDRVVRFAGDGSDEHRGSSIHGSALLVGQPFRQLNEKFIGVKKSQQLPQLSGLLFVETSPITGFFKRDIVVGERF